MKLLSEMMYEEGIESIIKPLFPRSTARAHKKITISAGKIFGIDTQDSNLSDIVRYDAKKNPQLYKYIENSLKKIEGPIMSGVSKSKMIAKAYLNKRPNNQTVQKYLNINNNAVVSYMSGRADLGFVRLKETDRDVLNTLIGHKLLSYYWSQGPVY